MWDVGCTFIGVITTIVIAGVSRVGTPAAKISVCSLGDAFRQIHAWFPRVLIGIVAKPFDEILFQGSPAALPYRAHATHFFNSVQANSLVGVLRRVVAYVYIDKCVRLRYCATFKKKKVLTAHF